MEYNRNQNQDKNKTVEVDKKEKISIKSSAVNRVVEVEHYKNKWQQLLTSYPEVHICEGAQTILIKPRDILILSEKYHELSTNSFLLHSYYNYRQLFLFRYTDTGEYYIGVPGIYSERQQRVAMMFGFEGFEGEASNGEYGYYMKRVEI
jgi:hypothetical protein